MLFIITVFQPSICAHNHAFYWYTHMWQSRIEMEYYSALYVFENMAIKVLYDYPVVLLTLPLFLVVVLVLC